MTNELPHSGTGGLPSEEEAHQAVEYPTDALVAVQGGLIFVTTGQMACHELGADLDQVALTPAVACRIAAALREALQHGGIQDRRVAIGVWGASEAAAIPHGRIVVDDRFVQIGIEPLGAGARVTIGWEYVPGLIIAIESAADWTLSYR